MMDVVARVAIAVVRVWTRMYTWRLEPSLRDARRAEIDSDLWECQTDDGRRIVVAVQIIGRLVFGVIDDLAWRIEHSRDRSRRAQRWVLVTLGISGLTACLWIALATSSVKMPQPPPALTFVARRTYYPVPPPPPPPPCPPPGLGLPRNHPCTP
jgi:hypothetical protein